MNLLIFILLLPLVVSCPSREALRPCTCSWPGAEDVAYVTCAGLDNEHDLATAGSSLVDKKHIYSVTIENSVFNFIPSDAFKGAMFVELDIKNTTLMALTDGDLAFEGLEDHLEILMMTDFVILNGWDWSIFKKLNKLMRLDIVHGNVDSIEDMGQLSLESVKDVHFDNNIISFVHPNAFATFSELAFLSLSHNKIQKVQRSMLPDPANQLLLVDFSYNEIEQLPGDIFTNMPTLQDVAIAANNILVLSENTFSPVWEQLDSFAAMGNDLRCDCRMSWLLGKKFPENLRAVCFQPPNLKGKNLKTLTSKDLWCYYAKPN